MSQHSRSEIHFWLAGPHYYAWLPQLSHIWISQTVCLLYSHQGSGNPYKTGPVSAIVHLKGKSVKVVPVACFKTGRELWLFQISVHAVGNPELRCLSFKVRALVRAAFHWHLVNNLSSQGDKWKKKKGSAHQKSLNSLVSSHPPTQGLSLNPKALSHPVQPVNTRDRPLRSEAPFTQQIIRKLLKNNHSNIKISRLASQKKRAHIKKAGEQVNSVGHVMKRSLSLQLVNMKALPNPLLSTAVFISQVERVVQEDHSPKPNSPQLFPGSPPHLAAVPSPTSQWWSDVQMLTCPHLLSFLCHWVHPFSAFQNNLCNPLLKKRRAAEGEVTCCIVFHTCPVFEG